jgi:carbonic anhydrase
VLAQVDNLHTHPSVRQALDEGRLDIHAWVYHIHSGEVWAYDEGTGRFGKWPGAVLPEPVRPHETK